MHKHCFVKHNWKIQPKYILIFFFTYAPCCHYFSLKFSLKWSSFVSSHNYSSCIFVHSFPHITKPCPLSSVFPLDTPHVCPFFPPVSCMSISWSLCLVIGLSCEGCLRSLFMKLLGVLLLSTQTCCFVNLTNFF